jgi:sortase A
MVRAVTIISADTSPLPAIRGEERNPFTSFSILKALLTLTMLAGFCFAGHGLYIKAKAELSQILLARAFQAELLGNRDAKPWPWADFKVEAKIEAPRLAASDIVLAGASGQALAFGPGHLTNTPLPGEIGTAVIAAHRDTHFAWLKDIKLGDAITVTLGDGRTLQFTVTSMRTARWNDSGINAHAFGRHLALVTCWPFDSAFHGDMRYIVEADLKS